MQNFGLVLDELAKIFEVHELGTIVVNFIQSIHYEASLKLLNMEKLAFIGRIIASKIFMDEGNFLHEFHKFRSTEARKIALPVILAAVDFHLKSSFEEERAQCLEILNAIIFLAESKIKVSIR